MKEGETYYYYHYDHLGTSQLISDSTSNISWSARHLTFGEVAFKEGNLVNNLRFPGQYYDQESGLHYNYSRYYDPGIGRFLQDDPIGLLGGINSYPYVNNNPVNLIDLFGLIGFPYPIPDFDVDPRTNLKIQKDRLLKSKQTLNVSLNRHLSNAS